MARKTYETEAHRIAEQKVADELDFAWQCKCRKLAYKHIVDFAICRGDDIKGWIEVKTRKISSTYLPQYMISMHKMNYAFNLSRETNLPFFLVVQFTDGLYYYKYNGEHHDLRWGGRFKTQRDDQDLEPCYYIDMKLFTKLR